MYSNGGYENDQISLANCNVYWNLLYAVYQDRLVKPFSPREK